MKYGRGETFAAAFLMTCTGVCDRKKKEMDKIQKFYDNLAPQYDKLFQDWHLAGREQAVLLDGLFCKYGYDKTVNVLDCACGIGTQAIGLARAGYRVTGSDLSAGALEEAKERAARLNTDISFVQADFRRLEDTFSDSFDIVIAMDNALPHMLTAEDLLKAVCSTVGCIYPGGLFVGSIRDYDALLQTKPPYSPPYIHKTAAGQRVSFQTWDWAGERYTLTQYIIEDEETLQVSKFDCEYRAVKRAELTQLFLSCGCSRITWLMPRESGFYQPIVIVQK